MMRKLNGYYAFFDVDETLISIKSMFSFLQYYVKHAPDITRVTTDKYHALIENIKFLSKKGVSREEINIKYYQFYQGIDEYILKKLGDEWHGDCLDNLKGFYNQVVVEELKKHRENGAHIVLVSGSFFACLTPIANHLQADAVLSTSLEISNSVCTGKILHYPVIGEGKAKAIKNYLSSINFYDYAQCYAYGDHISDLPLLNTVGNPIVYANCERVLKHARDHNWKIITSHCPLSTNK